MKINFLTEKKKNYSQTLSTKPLEILESITKRKIPITAKM